MTCGFQSSRFLLPVTFLNVHEHFKTSQCGKKTNKNSDLNIWYWNDRLAWHHFFEIIGFSWRSPHGNNLFSVMRQFWKVPLYFENERIKIVKKNMIDFFFQLLKKGSSDIKVSFFTRSWESPWSKLKGSLRGKLALSGSEPMIQTAGRKAMLAKS